MISPEAAERFAQSLETSMGDALNDEAFFDIATARAAITAAARSGGAVETVPRRADIASPPRHEMTLSARIATLKRHREAWRALVRDGGFALSDRDALDDLVVRHFDGMELDLCARWPNEAHLESFVGRIGHLHTLGAMSRPLGHEINNLLQPVIGMAYSVRRKVPEGSVEARNLTLILDAGKRASEVVNDLLGLARQRDGEPRPVDPSSELDLAVALLRFRPQPGVTTRAEPTRCVARVALAPGVMTRMVLNLAINGLEAMAHAGGELIISLFDTAGAVVLEVRDTGPGMSPEVLARCQEPFFTTKPSDPCAGLGLSVVRDLADAAGGAFEIDSAPGRGTTARVVLPVMSGP